MIHGDGAKGNFIELEPDQDTLAYLGIESGAEIFVL